MSASRRFAEDKRLGFGLGVYDRIEKTTVFPMVLVDWRFDDRWRLVNPLPAGPTGPAGIELDYRLNSASSIGLGAAWRTTRFRLSDANPAAAAGVGEERGAPLFVRLTHNISSNATLNLYAGVVVAGRLRVEDQSGNLLRSSDFDPAPLVGATFSGRF
jgi:hypothetical protein